MGRTIFYSWQSESPSGVCRNFIQTTLERALNSLGKDDSTEISPVLDRDTGDLPGTPSIPDEIFNKIVFSDVFVADVTLSRRTAEWRVFGFAITHRSRVRRSPNPNVLLELGFAAAHIGWHRIILVQNSEYGGPDELPFDLRGRRIVTYHLSPDDDDVKIARQDELSEHLEIALRAALLPDWKKTSRWERRWWGFWNAGEPDSPRGGNLLISETSTGGFTFHLKVYNGSHMGEVNGFAEFANRYTAEAGIDNPWENEVCKLRFRRSQEDLRALEIEEMNGCMALHGVGVGFAGTFVAEPEIVFENGFMNEIELQRLFTITGQYYRPLMRRFGGPETHKWEDERIQGEAFSGFVRGLPTIMEAIIMKGSRGQLWAAYIDDAQVRYFTTEKVYKDRLPATIENWRTRFRDKPVVFMNTVNTLPNEYGTLEDVERPISAPSQEAPANSHQDGLE